jgi:hypothetical protein
MDFNEERKTCEIAQLLKEHQGEEGLAAFISKRLGVSGRDVGKVKQMMKDDFIVFNRNGEARLIVPASEFEYLIAGKTLAEHGVKLQDITCAWMEKFLDSLGHLFRKPGRPKGSTVKSQLLIIKSLASGPKSFQEIVDATDLHRNTVANNLKMLCAMQVILKSKNGNKSSYETDLIRFYLFFKFGSVSKRKSKAIATSVKLAKELIGFVFRYLPEILELLRVQPSLIDKDLYVILRFARERHNTKREKEKRYLPTSSAGNPLLKNEKDCLSTSPEISDVLQKGIKTFLGRRAKMDHT